MMKRTFFTTTFLLVLALFSSASISFAQGVNPETIPDDDVNAIAKQLYCPVCENIPLDVCGTQACAQWRELIREKLAQGWNEEEIKEYFVLQYGDRVLAEPPRRGLNWLVYIVPPVVFLAGAYILYHGIQSWRQAGIPDSPGDEPEIKLMDDYVARMEDELRRSDH